MEKDDELNISKKYNILLLSPLAPPIGGISTWTDAYMKVQAKIGNKVFLVDTRKKNNSNGFFNQVIRTFKIIYNSLTNVRKNKIDIIHINSACSYFGMLREYIIIKLTHRKRIPIFFHCHCDVTKYVNSDKKVNLFKKILNYSNCIFVLNKQSFDYVKQLDKNKKVYLIDNFIDEDDVKFDFRIKDEVKNIVFVGRITAPKGCNELVECAKINQDFTFNLVGDFDTDFDRQKLDSVSNIKYLGRKEKNEVYSIINQNDVLILPSYAEGFPMVILEAMFLGIPIITTNVGSIFDMLGNDGCIYIEVGDVNSMNSALQKIQSKELRNSISTRNVIFAKEKYTAKTVVNRINNIYRIIRDDGDI